MRGFEFNSLCEQLQTQYTGDAIKLFDKYLECKSKYELNIAKKYEKYAQENDACKEIAQKYKNHAFLLKKASEPCTYYSDIKKAEAIKIQMANFINRQSPLQKVIARKINIDQIIEYSKYAQSYFKECLAEAKEKNDEKRIDYYKDCLKISHSFSGVEGWLEWQLKPTEEKEAMGLNKEALKKEEENYYVLQSKLTDEYEKTLDRIVCN